MLLKPSTEWLAIKNEPIYNHAELVKDFALPVIFVSIFIMLSLIGVSKHSVFFAIAAFVMAVLNLTLTSGLVLQISRRLSLSVDMVDATKWVVFSSIPFWLSFIFLSTHLFALLAGLIGSSYSIMVARSGLTSVLSPKKEKKNTLFFAAASMIFFLNFICLSLLLAVRRILLPDF